MALHLRQSVVALAMGTVLLSLGASGCKKGSGSSTGPSPLPPANSFSIQVTGVSGATGSGLVSVYYPKFQPGAQHIGTCVIDPGSAACSYTLTQSSGTVELVANGVTESNFTGWGSGVCASQSGNTCVVQVASNSAPQVSVTFSIPTVRVTLGATILTTANGRETGTLRTNHGHEIPLPGPSARRMDDGRLFSLAELDFEVPVTGADVRLTLQSDAGSVAKYLGAELILVQGSVMACDSHTAGTPAITCTFFLRPSELLPRATDFNPLALLVTLAPASTAPPPPPPGPGVSFSNQALRLGFVGIPYEDTFRAATGGFTPYRYSMGPPGLPPGVSYVDGPLGRQFAGTPQVAGNFATIVTVTDGTGAITTGTLGFPVVDPSDLNGRWRFTITVTHANNSCSDDVGVADPPEDITIAGASGLSLAFLAHGFLGISSNRLTGSFTEPGAPPPGTTPNWLPITLQGHYPEDGGQTTTRHLLTLTSPTRMIGDEYWSWDGGSGPGCNGRSVVEAVKIP